MSNTWQSRLASLASQALYAELACYPKAGLVSFKDSGSHRDMDQSTFLASIAALDSYWPQMIALGMANAHFLQLVKAGKAAEKAMLAATNGVNTHRGAIFILGILSAACAASYAAGAKFSAVSGVIRELWGTALLTHRPGATHGQQVRESYAEFGDDIISAAAGGFKALFATYLPRLQELYPDHGKTAYVELFYYLVSSVADTNLLYRGGPDGWQFARQQALAFIRSGGIKQADWYLQAKSIHQQFIAANLSPGGCADLLAATIFVYNAEVELWGLE